MASWLKAWGRRASWRAAEQMRDISCILRMVLEGCRRECWMFSILKLYASWVQLRVLYLEALREQRVQTCSADAFQSSDASRHVIYSSFRTHFLSSFQYYSAVKMLLTHLRRSATNSLDKSRLQLRLLWRQAPVPLAL